MSSFFDLSKTYNQYAQDVVDNKIVACKAVKQACQRYISWFDRDDIFFDYEDVEKKIALVHKMKHSRGKFAKQPFILLPWQTFVFAGIFGFKWCDTGYRVIKKSLLFISRKQGKTSLMAAIALVCSIADNEMGAEVDMVANNAKQASICYDQTCEYAESIDPKGKIFKRFRHNINIPMTKSIIQVHSSDSMGMDGYNSSVSIMDEFGAAKDWGLYNVLISSMGMRTQPLMLIITTASFLVGDTYPCYSMYSTCKQILNGLKEDDTMFALLYELDSDDDFKDESVWKKCAPSLNETVMPSYLREQVNDAINNTSLEIGVKTKSFNMWCQSADVWIPRDYIQNCMESVDINDYAGEIAFGGIDLSTVSDLSAIAYCIPPNPERQINPDKFIFGTKIFIPREAVINSANKEYYKEWERRGWAIITSGNVIDYNHILKELLEWNKTLEFADIAYDPYNSTSFIIQAEQEGLPMGSYSQTLGNFNKPSKFIQMLILSGKCIIDNNPIIDWMFANCEIMIDAHENIKPGKSGGDKNRKIDGVIAQIEALGAFLASNYYSPEMFVI